MEIKTEACRNGRQRWTAVRLSVLFGALAISGPALADKEKNKNKGENWPPRNWHGDISRFHEQDWPRWSAGHWTHGRHDGRMGWWWVVGPTWYFYPAPVYPYPSPWEPPTVMPLPQPGVVPPAPAAISWYYCPTNNNYYPYIATCISGWVKVPAQPR